MIDLIRIDDRLIHGQIISRWLGFCRAEIIIVVDDTSANDFMLKSILGLGVPSGVELKVVTKKQFVTDDSLINSSKPTLMIIKNPKELIELINIGYKVGEIPVVLGNMSPSVDFASKQKILDYIYVDKEDAEDLRTLSGLVKNLRVQAVPEEREKNILQLLERQNI